MRVCSRAALKDLQKVHAEAMVEIRAIRRLAFLQGKGEGKCARPNR